MLRRIFYASTVAALASSLLGIAGGSQVVHVSTCEPHRNQVTAYTPGFYPTSPYYWPNVYGVNYYQPPLRSSNPALLVDYTNVSAKPIKEIEFGLVARGTLVAEVKDVGTFSTGALIQHEFGLSPNVFPIGTGLAQCVPLKIKFQDGTKWRSPRLPALRRSAGM